MYQHSNSGESILLHKIGLVNSHKTYFDGFFIHFYPLWYLTEAIFEGIMSKQRIYLDVETAEQIVASADAARLSAQQDGADVHAALQRTCSVLQWIVHLAPFLPIHQKNWKERFGDDQ